MMMTIVKAVIIIALIAVLFYFFMKLVYLGEESSEREICRTSVLLQARSKALGDPLIESLNCKPDFKTIKTDDPEEIKMEITEELYDCWYMFGKHNKNFMHTSLLHLKDAKAFLCARLDFDERIHDNIESVDGFRTFWETHPLPFLSEQTFADYFDKGAFGITDSFTISTDRPVYIAFVMVEDANYLYPGGDPEFATETRTGYWYRLIFIGDSEHVINALEQHTLSLPLIRAQFKEGVNAFIYGVTHPSWDDFKSIFSEDFWIYMFQGYE